MTTSIHILIITLVCLTLALLAMLALMGKLDRWYSWSLSADAKPSEQSIMRWRVAFAAEVLIGLALVVVFNVSDVIDEYASLVVLALGIGMAVVEYLWIRKV